MSKTATAVKDVTVAVAGAAGRMGQRLVALAAETPGLKLTGAFEAPDHPAVGSDSGQIAGTRPNDVPITPGLQSKPRVVIDFTTPAVTRDLLTVCSYERIAMVIGTTGLKPDDHAAIDEAAKVIPIVQAPNMSLGVNLLLSLAAQAAAQLGDDYDIEVLEAHHRFKKDAPSGTALALMQSICKATGKDPAADVAYTRHGHEDIRQRGQITMQTLRMGDTVGEHTVYLSGLGERLELTHRASSRDTFARGALRAALWLRTKKHGRYDMRDVLGLAD